jgi:hypothetical protein
VGVLRGDQHTALAQTEEHVMQTYHVRIDRLTQGPPGREHVVDRLSVDSHDFLWIYVAALLPGSATPQGEYFKTVDGKPDPRTRVALGSPTKIGDEYRFSVVHFELAPETMYMFHVGDSLQQPAYEDAWEVRTVSAADLTYAESLTSDSIQNAVRFARAMERLSAPRPRLSATAPTPGPVVTNPPSSPASPVTLGAVPRYWTKACEGNDAYENNCAHFLSDAMIRTGFTQLKPPADCIDARCNTASKRPIRARDMWCWFKSMATKTSTTPTKNTGMWAVFQLREQEYWGGHVVMLDSDNWKYYGTSWYDDWDQYLYQW